MAKDKKAIKKHDALSRSPAVYYMPALVAAIAIGLFAYYADWQKTRLNQEAARALVTQQLTLVETRLEGYIDRNVALVQGLTEAIAENPAMTQAQLNSLAARILTYAPQVRNIAVAPNLKISMVYPFAGNEKAVGLDYLQNPAQREAALTVKQTGRMLITGPVKLVQGGTGLIARFPIMTAEPGNGRKFWGIVSAVMDIGRLYEDSGLLDAGSDIRIAIEAVSPGSAQSRFFFGDSAIRLQRPVSMAVDLGFDRWVLYAVPREGWNGGNDQLVFRLAILAVGLVLLLPLLWAGRLMSDRQAHIAALRKREEQLAELSHRLELALSTSKIGVWEFDISSSTLLWDRRMRDLYGIPPGQLICGYEDWRRTLHPDDIDEAERIFNEAMLGGKEYSTEFRIVLRSGEERHVRAFGTVYQDTEGHRKIIGVNWDVTEDIRLREDLMAAKLQTEIQNRSLEDARLEMERAALNDSLTELSNRRHLDKYLQSIDPDTDLTILHLDLDRFKEINDTYGHAAGDVILKEVASLLTGTVFDGDFVARIGGDEFIIVSGPDNGGRDYAALAIALVEVMSKPFSYDGHECRLGASIGLASANTSSETPSQLLINADIALYEAKRKGRNRVETFNDGLRLVAINNKRTADDILRGLEQNQFVAHYQPQFDANTFEIAGFEALARWAHPTKGLLAPDSFLRIAENLKVVSRIDGAILNQAHAQYMRMIANGIAIPKFSVNVSAQRLKEDAFLKRLDEISFKPGTLSVELLESISFETDDFDLLRQIDKMKAMGVDIEIDDFGTGRASILTLLKLMPRRLKIDRQLVFPIVTSKTQRALVRSIIDIGRSRDIEIVAEGVETFQHAQILRDLGCHMLQGYAFARPMDGSTFIEFAQKRAWFPDTVESAVSR